MPRRAPILITAFALAAALGARPPLAAHAAGLAQLPPAAPAQATETETPAPTETPTPTDTAVPTATNTPAPTITPLAAWQVVVTLPASGAAVLIERRWTFGEEAIFLALVGLGALVGLRWIYDLTRQEARRQ